MLTEELAYSDYLEAKYLPGRGFYLKHFFYPKITKMFRGAEPILDLGCGTGEFLKYCKENGRAALGIDSNRQFVSKCQQKNLTADYDNICQLDSLNQQQFKNVISDNVLEHLSLEHIQQFFDRLQRLLSPGGRFICIVPGKKGFQKDPTHKTFVCLELLNGLLAGSSLRIVTRYHHPINCAWVGNFLYLNMQVFEILKSQTGI
jgi:SAM-dependent methyltransferase